MAGVAAFDAITAGRALAQQASAIFQLKPAMSAGSQLLQIDFLLYVDLSGRYSETMRV